MQVCVSMYDLLLPPGTKGLREKNICETKNWEIKVCELDLENWKNCGMNKFLLHVRIYLWTLFYYGMKSHKIERTFKPYD